MENETADIVFFVVASTVVFVLLAVLVINLLLAARNRRLKHRNEVLEMKTRFENELMKTQVEVAENTLNDIARDLHDDIGQMLTFCLLSINRMDVTQYPALTQNVTEMRDGLQQSLQSVRSISKTLSHDYISSFGIYEALKRLVERVNRQGVKMELAFAEGVIFGSKPNEIFAFRIIQELVANTLKHAEAHNISIEVKETGHQMTIKYSDYGKGLDVGYVMQPEKLKSSMGLSNIYKRAELIKGKIILDSKAGNGFTFEITFPNT